MLVDCDIAFARHPPSLSVPFVPPAGVAVPIFHPTPIGLVSFRFFVLASTHSIPHTGIQKLPGYLRYQYSYIHISLSLDLVHTPSPLQFRDLRICEVLNSWTPKFPEVSRDVSRKLHIEIIQAAMKYRGGYLRNVKFLYGVNYFKRAGGGGNY